MRHVFVKSFCLILFLLSCFLAFPSEVRAELEYKIQPVIFIPADWRYRINENDLVRYMQNIRGGLKEIQSFYGSKLNGKTFNIDPYVFTIHTDKKISDITNPYPANNYELFLRLNGFNQSQLRPAEGIIHAIWIVGSKVEVRYGGWFYTPKHSSSAIMNFADLVNLDPPHPTRDPALRNSSLGIIAHEIGHALKLVNDGFAKTHPCSEASPQECLSSAPKPYPPTDEWSDSVMGYGGIGLYPKTGFNNSTYNPEIQKLYKSPFINPINAPAPSPIPPIRPSQATISPNTITHGQILKIKGYDFGTDKGTLNFQNIYYKPTLMTLYEIIEWQDNLIKVRVDNPKDQGFEANTEWEIKVLDLQGKLRATSSKHLFIESSEKPSVFLNGKILAECGQERKPLAGIDFSFRISQTEKESKFTTSANGTFSLTWQIDESLPVTYSLQAPQVTDIQAEKTTAAITITKAENTNWDVNFHYPECPATSLSTSSPTPSPIITPTPIPQSSITHLTSCQEITKSGKYILDQDLTGAKNTVCLNIHDVKNVELDCNNHSISSLGPAFVEYQIGGFLIGTIFVKTVDTFTIKSCKLPSNNAYNPAVDKVVILKSENGIINDNTIENHEVQVKESQNIKFSQNTINGGGYYQFASQNNVIEGNLFNSFSQGEIYERGLIDGLIVLNSGSNNQVVNNTIDGKSDGILQNKKGADDGIVLFDGESNDVIKDNIILNVWDCGIETSTGLIKSNIIADNKIKNAGVCGIGAWFLLSWLGNTISGNTVEDSPQLFTFYWATSNPKFKVTEPVYFKDNKFENNKLVKRQESSMSEYSTRVNLGSNSQVPQDKWVLGNNTFSNNDFGLENAPYLWPLSMIVDGGGNNCINAHTHPLKCASSSPTPPTPEESATLIPTPTPQGGEEEPALPAGGPEQIIISNYEDFREDNAPSDQGSETIIIENPNEQQEIKWQESTLSQDQPTFIREIYEDGTVKDFEVNLNEGQSTQIGNIEIEAVGPPPQTISTRQPKILTIFGLSTDSLNQITQGDTVVGTSIPNTSLSISISPNGTNQNIASDTQGNFSFKIPEDLNIGNYNLTVTLQDKAENIASVKTYPIFVNPKQVGGAGFICLPIIQEFCPTTSQCVRRGDCPAPSQPQPSPLPIPRELEALGPEYNDWIKKMHLLGIYPAKDIKTGEIVFVSREEFETEVCLSKRCTQNPDFDSFINSVASNNIQYIEKLGALLRNDCFIAFEAIQPFFPDAQEFFDKNKYPSLVYLYTPLPNCTESDIKYDIEEDALAAYITQAANQYVLDQEDPFRDLVIATDGFFSTGTILKLFALTDGYQANTEDVINTGFALADILPPAKVVGGTKKVTTIGSKIINSRTVLKVKKMTGDMSRIRQAITRGERVLQSAVEETIASHVEEIPLTKSGRLDPPSRIPPRDSNELFFYNYIKPAIDAGKAWSIPSEVLRPAVNDVSKALHDLETKIGTKFVDETNFHRAIEEGRVFVIADDYWDNLFKDILGSQESGAKITGWAPSTEFATLSESAYESLRRDHTLRHELTHLIGHSSRIPYPSSSTDEFNRVELLIYELMTDYQTDLARGISPFSSSSDANYPIKNPEVRQALFDHLVQAKPDILIELQRYTYTRDTARLLERVTEKAGGAEAEQELLGWFRNEARINVNAITVGASGTILLGPDLFLGNADEDVTIIEVEGDIKLGGIIKVDVLETESGVISSQADQLKEVFTVHAQQNPQSINELTPLSAQEVNPQTYEITIPDDSKPGLYCLKAYLYRQGSDEILDESECHSLAIEVEPPKPSPPPKKVVSVKINDQEVDLDNLTLNLHLPGTESETQTFQIPVEVTFSDNTKRFIILKFNYQPSPSQPSPTPEDSTVQPSPTSQTCPNWQFLRNECTGCNQARSVEKNSCTGQTRISAENVYDSGCSGPQWCQQPTPTPTLTPEPTETPATSCITSCGKNNGQNCTNKDKADTECADYHEDESICSFTNPGPRGDGCIP